MMATEMSLSPVRSAPGPEQRVILVAEDEVIILEFVRSTLERAGHFVLVACDGLEALEVSESFRGSIDAVVTDVKMPQLDGLELVERLLVQRPAVRVLFMSGKTDSSPRYGCGFLPKPFSAAVLRERVGPLVAQVRTA